GKTMGYSYAITAAVRKMTRAPMILTGKPSLHALRLVAKKLGVPMRKVAVVGDDPLVEMIMARRGGSVGIGVTTGMTKAQEWMVQPLNRRPHLVLRDLRELLRLNAMRGKSSTKK
ncbi:MAG TPA: HAD hydrolase-like protein, partial [Candidatus Acidoferrum sp.]|nr:HAD hydrolase-like protein [Candidatus Acidoferrum sp.]